MTTSPSVFPLYQLNLSSWNPGGDPSNLFQGTTVITYYQLPFTPYYIFGWTVGSTPYGMGLRKSGNSFSANNVALGTSFIGSVSIVNTGGSNWQGTLTQNSGGGTPDPGVFIATGPTGSDPDGGPQ